MDGSTESVPAAPAPPSPELDLARALGLRPETARRLVEAGYATADAVRALSAEELERFGADAQERTAVLEVSGGGSHGPGADNDQRLDRWAGIVSHTDRPRRRKVSIAPKDSADVLRKWVEGDDRAMEDWIQASESTGSGPPSPARPSAPGAEAGGRRVGPEGSATPAVLEREETVVRWLTGLLDRVKTDQFDPAAMIQEVQDLQRQLYDERTRRKTLEDQVEHVKRGSIAVIKYVRSREAKERESAVREKDVEIEQLRQRLGALGDVPPPRPADPDAPSAAPAPAAVATGEADARLREEFADREHDYIERETELRRRVVQLEGEVRRLVGESEQARERDSLTSARAGQIDAETTRRLEEIAQRQRDLVARENELRAKFEEIRISAEEVERRRGPIEFKERELSAYDQQLQTRRQALDIEARRLEEIRRGLNATGTTVAVSEAQRLEDLRHELSQKEVELKAREAQLHERVQELERMGGRTAEAEADRMHEESVADAQAAKVKSGIRRLDDLLFGGFPAGVQVMVNGPAHTGKDVLARLFSVEGLKQGIPSIWVVTDKTHQQVRDDLAGLFPGYADAEKNGMIRYVDLYSRSVGSTASSPGVRLLSSTDKAVLDQIGQSVNGFAEELKEGHATYRLIFESVSTLTAYMDSAATFRFLQPFIGRRKLDGAVGYYVLDSGMHSDSDMETLEHMVDGSINLKVEQMKTFLSVRGIGDAQARSWVGYTFTKRSFNLGSFSLEHIR
ncbi:MAG TPA: ATPase domain-containing protein [Thermoplasmata archaeon]|nr:ATPase domain-containing protein [Thermoplasmata archaeon]